MSKEVEVNIDLVYPMVKAKATNELEQNMHCTEQVEFTHPVILYRTTKYEWEQMMKNYPQILPPPNTGGSILQVRCGHNRIELAKRWGRDTIKAVIFDRLADATLNCQNQQRWYKQRYGSLD